MARSRPISKGLNMTDELKPCPMCGSPAEMDTQRGYRRMRDGSIGNAVAVYCTQCSLDISVCRDDVPDIEPEQVAEMWNRRVQPTTLAMQALENCRLFAARHRKEEWSTTIRRFCAEGGATGSPLRDAQPAAPSVTPEPVADAEYLRIAQLAALLTWEKRDYLPRAMGEHKNFIPHQWVIEAMKAAVREATNPPRAPSVAPEPPRRGPDGYSITGIADLRDAKWLDPECADFGVCQSLKFKAACPPRAPMTEGALMGIYMEFDRHADKAWTPTEYLLRFAAAVDAHGIRGQG